MNRTRIITAALTLATAGLLFAGPLTPPVGPVTSTNKTLQEVEPRTAINLTNTPGDADSLFKITQPGSYYVTGNITGVVGKHGIEITASGVTLDLMGFDLSGIPAMGSFDGVSVAANLLTNITIRNGSVRNWGDEGVDLASFGALNSAVIDIRASNNAGSGIAVGNGSAVTGCSAYGNTAAGITTSSGCAIIGCSANNNTGSGISAGIASAISGCSAYQNAANGISFGSGSTITGSTAYQNAASGIFTNANGSTITGCTAAFNTGSGISAGIGCIISNCTVRSNVLDGIVVSNGCLILANTCSLNGNGGDGAGIHVTGNDNRIEGNTCTGADRGIDVDFAFNIIIKNTCSRNTTNWVIFQNNICGPILDRTSPISPAISGNSAPSSLGTTDPNANFSY